MTASTLPQSALIFLAGLVIGALLSWLYARARAAGRVERLRLCEAELARSTRAVEENQQLRIEVARLVAERDADAERLAWIHTADEQLRMSFQALASQILQEGFRALTDRSENKIEHMLSGLQKDWQGQNSELRRVIEPIEKTLAGLDAQVRQLEAERQGAYQGLKQEVGLLRRAHHELRDTTVSLRQALRSPTVRGRWGEVQLRRVVEMAGMVPHVDFEEQPNVDGLRPDMIVRLPHQGILPVDAKTPMEAYLTANAAEDEGARRTALDAHRKALRQRIQELGQRRYWEQFEDSPDFVVMFVPSDGCLGSAFERDPDLLDFALRCRVLPATPITLLALLKAVAHGWRQRQVTENARQIGELGRELHDRLGRFVGHLRDVGKELDQTVRAYNQALGSLERRVMPTVRKLEEVGAANRSVEVAEPLERRPREPTTDARDARDDES